MILPCIAAPRILARTHCRPTLTVLLLGILLTAGCGSRRAAEEPVGEAFAGPANLNLRKELGGRSSVMAVAKHGDRLDILEIRRRFARVRTQEGVEGWTDSNLLLSSSEMDRLSALAIRASRMPSQGTASVFDALNMHPEPRRQSPSFFQIPENGSVEVVDHAIRPRIQANAPARASTPPRDARGTKKKAKRDKQGPPLMAPRLPSPPAGWELARPRSYDLAGSSTAAPAAPVLMDDWSLVRTPEGEAGWVLSRLLFMNVPDEVAQYAEGHRITAYLPLGEVKDRDQVKKNWLWTTASPGVRASEFDSFRVFVWSTQRHRYETAYLERGVTGYYPIEVVSIPGQQEKGFTVILEEPSGGVRSTARSSEGGLRGGKRSKRAAANRETSQRADGGEGRHNGSGKLYRRTYAFAGYRVRMISEQPYERPVENAFHASKGSTAAPVKTDNWWSRISDWARRPWEQWRAR